MANVLVDEQYLRDTADAIRSKNGESTTYKPGEFAGAIEAIETSGGGSGSVDGVPWRSLMTDDTTYFEDDDYIDVDAGSFAWDEWRSDLEIRPYAFYYLSKALRSAYWSKRAHVNTATTNGSGAYAYAYTNPEKITIEAGATIPYACFSRANRDKRTLREMSDNIIITGTNDDGLVDIGQHAFEYSFKYDDINYTGDCGFPFDRVGVIHSHAFYYCYMYGTVKLPANVSFDSSADSIFAQSTIKTLDLTENFNITTFTSGYVSGAAQLRSLRIPNVKVLKSTSFSIQNICAEDNNCLYLPSIEQIQSSLSSTSIYGIKTVVMGENLVQLNKSGTYYDYIIGSSYLKKLVFYGDTPPTESAGKLCSNSSWCATVHIYVPDDALDTWVEFFSTLSDYSSFSDNIHGLSELTGDYLPSWVTE